MAMIPYSTPNVQLTYLSATDLNELRSNALLIDMLSYRGRRPWLDQTRILNDAGGNPSPIGRGSFVFLTGLTTATFVMGTNIGTATLQILFNGATVYSATLAAGTSTVNVTLTGLGYTDYQIIDVVIQAAVTWSGSNIFRCYDAYTSPWASVMTTAWPTVPTFGSISPANLAQLASCDTWLMNRLSSVMEPVFFTQQYTSYASWVTTDLVWQGGIAKANGADRLMIGVGHITVTNQAEHLEVYINDILVATGPTWTAGDSGNYSFDIDISGYGDATLFALRIMFVVTTGAVAGVKWHSSRLILSTIHTQRATYSPATPPTFSIIGESISFTTAQSRLNAIGTILTNAYNRITAATDVFNRVRMFRWLPATDDGQRKYFSSLNAYLPGGFRHGDSLWVRGAGLKIAYGARKVTSSLDDSYKLEFNYNEDLISGETVQDTLVYFDAYAGLFPGASWFILGEDVRAAFTQLR